MLGAIFMFLLIMGAFLWHLASETEKERGKSSSSSSNSSNYTEQSRQESMQGAARKRNRKKRKQQGGKKGANKDRSVPSLDDATDGRASDNVDQTTTGQRKNTTSAARSLKQKGKLKQQALDTNEWPSLNQNKRTGEPSSRPEGQEKAPFFSQEEEEEDLVALHAALLKVAKSSSDVSPGAGGNANSRSRCGGRIGVGDKVKARFEGGVEWFPAIVTKTLHGGLVNLLYDDGERETRVPLSFVRSSDAKVKALSESSYGSDSGSDSGSDYDCVSDNIEESAGSNRSSAPAQGKQGKSDRWKVMVQKPKKTSQERVEARAETSSNMKNRIKRHKKREKELAAREALRKKL